MLAKFEQETEEVEMRYWSKASITVYKYLGTMTKTIDKIIHNITKTSNSLISQKSHSTYSLASNLIELMDRKRKMIKRLILLGSKRNQLKGGKKHGKDN